VHDCAKHRVLGRMGLYEQRIERSFLRTMSELQKQQVMRQAEPEGASKFEIQSTESETNPNDRNSNDRKDDRVGCARQTTCDGPGDEPVRSACGAHPTKTGDGEGAFVSPLDSAKGAEPDSHKQSQFGVQTAQTGLPVDHKNLSNKELQPERATTVQS